MKTPLYNYHAGVGAKIVPFAGYNMPISYNLGMIEEHLWVRNSCGIFDVSHMGQVIFEGENLSDIFLKLTPSNFHNVKLGSCKYTVLTNENAGIIDDLIITKITESRFFVVWNASRKHENLKHVLHYFPDIQHTILEDRALIAVQGSKTISVLSGIFPQIDAIQYMCGVELSHQKYGNIFLTRTGYTGEIGYEISVDSSLALQLWNEILDNKSVQPIGLGARDTLRLESGYPLYGNDIDTETDPISAGLSWVMSKDNTSYIGYNALVSKEKSLKRVGILLESGGILRHGYEIFDLQNNKIGVVTSGGYSPILQKSIGQAYLPINFQKDDNIMIGIRGKLIGAKVATLCFVKTNAK